MLEKGEKVRLGRSRNDLDQALLEKKVKDEFAEVSGEDVLHPPNHRTTLSIASYKLFNYPFK